MTTKNKIKAILTHIRSVQTIAEKLANELVDLNYEGEAQALLHSVMMHDASKFSPEEFQYVATYGDEGLDLKKKMEAVQIHIKKNKHHPEWWQKGIQGMEKTDVMELTCDWYSRSQEFHGDIRKWIHDEAMAKFKMTKTDAVYHQIMYFIDLIEKKK